MGSDAYPPEIMALMSAAFDAACARLLEEPTQALQLQLAARIIAAIKTGERDIERLSRLALGQNIEDLDGSAQAPAVRADIDTSAG